MKMYFAVCDYVEGGDLYVVRARFRNQSNAEKRAEAENRTVVPFKHGQSLGGTICGDTARANQRQMQ